MNSERDVPREVRAEGAWRPRGCAIDSSRRVACSRARGRWPCCPAFAKGCVRGAVLPWWHARIMQPTATDVPAGRPRRRRGSSASGSESTWLLLMAGDVVADGHMSELSFLYATPQGGGYADADPVSSFRLLRCACQRHVRLRIEARSTWQTVFQLWNAPGWKDGRQSISSVLIKGQSCLVAWALASFFLSFERAWALDSSWHASYTWRTRMIILHHFPF